MPEDLLCPYGRAELIELSALLANRKFSFLLSSLSPFMWSITTR